MQKVAVISALNSELSPISKYLTKIKLLANLSGIKIYEGVLDNQISVITAAFGMGKVLASITTQYLIDSTSLDAVVLVGACGGFSNKVNKGDILVSTCSIQADMDLSSTGKKLGVYQGPDEVNKERKVDHDKDLISQAKKVDAQLNTINGYTPEIKYGPMISHDKIETDKRKVENLYKEFGCYGVDMETAGAAITCRYNEVPFGSIKSVFDLDGEFDLNEYNKNVPTYHENSTILAIGIIRNLYCS